jgi:hypothetical protein
MGFSNHSFKSPLGGAGRGAPLRCAPASDPQTRPGFLQKPLPRICNIAFAPRRLSLRRGARDALEAIIRLTRAIPVRVWPPWQRPPQTADWNSRGARGSSAARVCVGVVHGPSGGARTWPLGRANCENILPAVPTIHHGIDRARKLHSHGVRLVTSNHRKTTPERPTEASVGTNLRLDPFPVPSPHFCFQLSAFQRFPSSCRSWQSGALLASWHIRR